MNKEKINRYLSIAIVVIVILLIGMVFMFPGDKKTDKPNKNKPIQNHLKSAKNTTTTDLLNSENDGTLKNGYYKTDVELTASDTWEEKDKDSTVKVIAGDNQTLSLKVSKKIFETLTDGTKGQALIEVKDIKLAGSTFPDFFLKSINISEGKTNSSEKEAASESKLYEAISTQKDSLNQLVYSDLNANVIDSIDEHDSGAYYVQLNSVMSSATDNELKSIINSINTQLVNTASSNGNSNPMFKYYIGSLKIGENKSVLDPETVKFEN